LNGLRRVGSEANPETSHLHPGRFVFLGGCGFHSDRQADIGLACQAYRAEAIARLDQIFAAVPVVGAVSIPVIVVEPVKPVSAYLAANS